MARSVWNRMPATPKAIPTASAVSAVGRRSSRTTKSRRRIAREVKRGGEHLPRARGRSSRPSSSRTNRPSPTTASAPVTSTSSAAAGASGSRRCRYECGRRRRSRPRACSTIRAPPGSRSGRGRRRRGLRARRGATPTWSSPGETTTRPTMSASRSSDRGEHERVGQDPAVVRAAEQAREVRHDEPDEGDRAARRGRRAAEQRRP